MLNVCILHFKHLCCMFTVMSDFPSAEHWWIALGEIYISSVHVFVCPSMYALICLQPHLQKMKTKLPIFHYLLSVCSRYYFSCFQTHFLGSFRLRVFEDSGCCWYLNLPLINPIFSII